MKKFWKDSPWQDQRVAYETDKDIEHRLRQLLWEQGEYKAAARASVVALGPVDGRYNPDYAHESWLLGKQLEFGPRLAPHKGQVPVLSGNAGDRHE